MNKLFGQKGLLIISQVENSRKVSLVELLGRRGKVLTVKISI